MSDSNQSGSKQTSTRPNRRAALKAAGASIAGVTLPIEMVGAVVPGSGYDGELVSVRRDRDDPLSADEVLDLQAAAAARYRDETGSAEQIGKSAPEADADVYAFSYRIDGAGRPATYFGTAAGDTRPSNRELARLHRHATEFEELVAESSAPAYQRDVEELDSGASTASAGSTTDWGEPVASDYREQVDDPYGVLYSRSDIYEYVDSDDDIVAYLDDHLLEVSPGGQEWGTDWHNDLCSEELRWSDYEPGDATLDERVPNGNRDGDYYVSASMGYETAEVSVSYNPPDIYRWDETKRTEDLQKLWWNFESGIWNPQQFDVAGQMRTGTRADSWDTLLSTYNDARWRHSLTLDTHLTDHTLYYYY